nr:uncharacterized protein LOC117279997 [Nicotiana tomentosiformis]
MGFSLSVQSNPALDGTKDMNMMIRLLDKLDILLKLGIRSTILELMKVAAKFDDPAIFQVSPSYEEVTMDLLAGGHNEGFAVLAKVLYPVNNEKIYPLYYVLCDTKLDCFILTVHGIHEMAVSLLHCAVLIFFWHICIIIRISMDPKKKKMVLIHHFIRAAEAS